MLQRDVPPTKLKDIPISVFEWIQVERRYERRSWAIRQHVDNYLAREASPDPTKVGRLLSMVEISAWSSKLDALRGVGKGDSEGHLKELAERRNGIAHSLDRAGNSQRVLSVSEATRFVANAKSVVEALERLFEQTEVEEAKTAADAKAKKQADREARQAAKVAAKATRAVKRAVRDARVKERLADTSAGGAEVAG